MSIYFILVVENAKGFDIYLFLFNDVLLLTKPKKIHRKVTDVSNNVARFCRPDNSFFSDFSIETFPGQLSHDSTDDIFQ